MWNSIIAGGATGFTLAVRQGMAPALVSGGIGKVILISSKFEIQMVWN